MLNRRFGVTDCILASMAIDGVDNSVAWEADLIICKRTRPVLRSMRQMTTWFCDLASVSKSASLETVALHPGIQGLELPPIRFNEVSAWNLGLLSKGAHNLCLPRPLTNNCLCGLCFVSSGEMALR